MIFIALGANMDSIVGKPTDTLLKAIEVLAAQEIRVAKVSAFYSTPAWPDPAAPSFVNAVIAVETQLPPAELLGLLHDVEARFGRQRSIANAPRPLDLDLLDYEGHIERGWPLLPHPRVGERAFVLVPLADVAPGWKHPVSGVMISQLIAALPQETKDAVIPIRL